MTGNYDHDEGAEGTGIAGNNESERGTAGSMTGSHGSRKGQNKPKIAELLLARSIQNHVLNVTGLPDLDRALLVNLNKQNCKAHEQKKWHCSECFDNGRNEEDYPPPTFVSSTKFAKDFSQH